MPRLFLLFVVVLLQVIGGAAWIAFDCASAQTLAGSESQPEPAAARRALVIGNSAYAHATPLANAATDAAAVADALRKLNFVVTVGLDIDGDEFRELVAQFHETIGPGDVTLFYYGGHGLQLNGQNYLIPVDAELRRPADLPLRAERLDDIISAMTVEENTAIVLLDACRDNPFTRQLAAAAKSRNVVVGQGLGAVDAGTGVYIGFATQPGNVALDGNGSFSPFAEGLLKRIATPSIDIEILMRRVRMDVMKSTGGQQVPWSNSSLLEPGFAFNPDGVSSANTTSIQEDLDLAFWNSVKDTSDVGMLKAYLNAFPGGHFAVDAKSLLARLEPKRPAATSVAPAKPSTKQGAGKSKGQARASEADTAKPTTAIRSPVQRNATSGRCVDGDIERCRRNCRMGRRGACRMLEKLVTKPP